MTKKFLLGMVMTLAAASAAQAQEFNIIETRQAGQNLLSGDFTGIRAVVAAKGDVKTLENPAKAMARWMTQFPTTFPAGSDKGPTKALPAVWSDPAGFRKAAGDFVEAAEKLTQLAKAGDAEGVAAQVKVVGDACSACHRTYRQR
jgi:cytochrome c556